ncbi:hypothetical protein F5Y14DRAFT_407339 [Nemania sp. NC0429]|nr:hypothetical protein F5Y14DRAFT_407339 [Nemania sp. NC0429]
MQTDNHTTVLGTLNRVQEGLELHAEEIAQSNLRKKLLGSLWFPDIDQRRSEIKEPTPKTLDWLFGSDSHSDTDSSTELSFNSWSDPEPKWPNFLQWLCEDYTSPYWVSGKAGSGKSTLMAYIVDDKRTRHHLETWSGRHQLVVLSFFFWRAGSRLQNNIVGLLRSLLYQLCNELGTIADTVLAHLSFPTGMIPTWTEKSLLESISRAFQSSQETYFCVFIDGLDESTDSYEHLIDNITKFEPFRNVKFCVSSRPELEFSDFFRDSKQLRLQDLNYKDIWKFVKQSLRKTSLSAENRAIFSEAIASRAEGVFLWASLVTQSFVKGIKAGDEEDIMWKRIESQPKTLDKLFKQMLSKLDPVYQESLAFYVQVMNLVNDPTFENEASCMALRTIPILTTARLKHSVDSYEKFADECKLTETRITFQSAGLLEVDFVAYIAGYNAMEWHRDKSKHVSNQPCFRVGSVKINRRRCHSYEQYPVMLDYTNRGMHWIHRSAFDFLSDSNNNLQLLELSLSPEALFQRLGDSFINYITAAPSISIGDGMSGTVARLNLVGQFVFSSYDKYPVAASLLLDKMRSIYNGCDPDELIGADSHSWFDPATTTYTGEIAFWSTCVVGSCYPYLLSKMDQILASHTLSAHLLAWIVECSITYKDLGQFKDDLPPILARLGKSLLQDIVQRSELDGIVQDTKYRCIAPVDACPTGPWGPFFWGMSFIGASWKEPVMSDSIEVIKSLIFVLSYAFVFGLDNELLSPIMPLLSSSFHGLLDITDLYLAPNIALNRICIQISAEVWLAASRRQAEIDQPGSELGNLGNDFSRYLVRGAVRVLCVPSLERHPVFMSTLDFEDSTRLETEWEPVAELQPSQFLSLQPSPETSEQLLRLIDYTLTTTEANMILAKFKMAPDSQKLREEVCGMLCQEIQLVEQGLNEGQQLIATTCVQEGLLDPVLDEPAADIDIGSGISSEYSSEYSLEYSSEPQSP